MSDVSTWMPLYGGDFLVATIGWPADAVGHYIKILLLQWDRGGLPKDISEWESLSPGVSQHESLLLPKFPIGADGKRYNHRLEDEKHKAVKLRTQRAEAGRKGAAKRWENDNVLPPKTAVSTPSSIHRGSKEANLAWEFVPTLRKTGKRKFLNLWETLVLRQGLDHEKVIKSFEDYYNSPKGKGEYARGPIRLLEEAVWEDDPKSWGENNTESISHLDAIYAEQQNGEL
tara:strand:- start:2783 stop:3469 length:687 start_codon:yes stop_codon:yes gene_type:complete